MRKLYMIISLAAILTLSIKTQAQFYDGFTGTGNIGGTCSDATCNNNGWYTHSNSKPATIDILSGSLNYTGLAASTGNRVYISGNTLELTRDVNAAVTGLTTVAYYSALIKVIDTTNLSATGFDYFMSLGATAGQSLTSMFARLGIKSSNNKTNFRFGLLNNSGGTAYTEYATDLVFGTTYLVVVKFDMTSKAASLWVNPSTLGGAEPSGSITNTSSTTAPAAIASVVIRNGYNSTNLGGTPKAEIDEIRVGATFATVTPAFAGINSISKANISVYPNPAKDMLFVRNAEGVNRIEICNIIGTKAISQKLDSNGQIEVANLKKGIYFISLYSDNEIITTIKFIKE